MQDDSSTMRTVMTVVAVACAVGAAWRFLAGDPWFALVLTLATVVAVVMVLPARRERAARQKEGESARVTVGIDFDDLREVAAYFGPPTTPLGATATMTADARGLRLWARGVDGGAAYAFGWAQIADVEGQGEGILVTLLPVPGFPVFLRLRTPGEHGAALAGELQDLRIA